MNVLTFGCADDIIIVVSGRFISQGIERTLNITPELNINP